VLFFTRGVAQQQTCEATVDRVPNPIIARRAVLRGLAAGTVAAAAAASTAPAASAATDTQNRKKAGRARYNAASTEVQTFYRVNRYPPK
jgi:hypothetical protein